MNKEESIQQIETLIEAWQLDEADLNQTDINAMQTLLEENQKLKKQVEVSNELVAQSTLTEMKLRNEFNRWKKEYQDTYKDVRIEIKEYKTQQKEFIKYLEDEIERKRKNATCMFEYNDTVLPLKEVLQEYKEIIGVSDEKK